jgi:polyisoprenoid-binding protein YceI
MTRSSKRLTWMIALASIALVACQHRTIPSATPTAPHEYPPGFPTQFYSSQPPDAVYRVVPARSSLIIKVYRAGALAALGHNHVITSAAVDGFVYLADDFANARADVFVPVDSFVVDDAGARATAGPDFTTQPTAADIAGTREHMLGASLLDAAEHPFIRIHVAPLHVTEQSTQVELTIEVRGKTATQPVDVVWRRSGSDLTISAQFKIDHATLGLEPYAALGGAMRVGDPIDISVALIAATRAH